MKINMISISVVRLRRGVTTRTGLLRALQTRTHVRSIGTNRQIPTKQFNKLTRPNWDEKTQGILVQFADLGTDGTKSVPPSSPLNRRIVRTKKPLSLRIFCAAACTPVPSKIVRGQKKYEIRKGQRVLVVSRRRKN